MGHTAAALNCAGRVITVLHMCKLEMGHTAAVALCAVSIRSGLKTLVHQVKTGGSCKYLCICLILLFWCHRTVLKYLITLQLEGLQSLVIDLHFFPLINLEISSEVLKEWPFFDILHRFLVLFIYILFSLYLSQ